MNLLHDSVSFYECHVFSICSLKCPMDTIEIPTCLSHHLISHFSSHVSSPCHMRVCPVLFVLALSPWCSELSVATSNALVPEAGNRNKCSNSPTVRISSARVLRASGSGVRDQFKGLTVRIVNTLGTIFSKKVPADEVKHWLKEIEDPAKAFTSLGLDKRSKNLFQSDHFLEWLEHVRDFNQENPTTRKSILTILRDHHDVADLMKYAYGATWEDAHVKKVVATNLMDELMTQLIETKGLTTVLPLLGLSSNIDVRSERYLIDVCAKLLENYMHKFPRRKAVLVDTLVPRLGNEFVAVAIHATNPSVARSLERALRRDYWLNYKLSGEKVFELLNLASSPRDSFHRQALATWLKYVDVELERNPQLKKKLLSQLTPRQGSTARTTRDAIAFYYLQRNVISPEDMFVVMRLGKKNGESIVQNPWFPAWLAYMKRYSRVHSEYKASLVTIFFSHFGSDRTFQLLDELYQYCLENKVKPAQFKWILSRDQAIEDSPLYERWKLYRDEFEKSARENADRETGRILLYRSNWVGPLSLLREPTDPGPRHEGDVVVTKHVRVRVAPTRCLETTRVTPKHVHPTVGTSEPFERLMRLLTRRTVPRHGLRVALHGHAFIKDKVLPFKEAAAIGKRLQVAMNAALAASACESSVAIGQTVASWDSTRPESVRLDIRTHCGHQGVQSSRAQQGLEPLEMHADLSGYRVGLHPRLSEVTPTRQSHAQPALVTRETALRARH
ncbi:hypothetical protein PsorP6_014547 [Peronosclerospora sorghi]|uniref:Uncharacterized protein n=1 Tax=Peronosclerospora sorghi TaxID=230839 RepID=A0ACC0VS77_9STRA|nr:hypothetical protein PsorP6_014547 [Peronosclerospora sorghi]